MRAFTFMAVALAVAAAHAEEAPEQEQGALDTGAADTGTEPGDPTLTPAADSPVEGGVAGEAGADRPFEIGAGLSFRMLAVEDEDPTNDRALLYSLNAAVEPFENASVFIRAGFTQYFVVEEGGTVENPAGDFVVAGEDESVRIQDTQIGMSYKTPIALTEDRDLALVHTFKLFLPTSRISRARDLYVAPQGIITAASKIVGGLSASMSASFRYRFHAFAERAGEEGGMNTQLDTGVRFGLGYAIFAGKPYGSLEASTNVLSNWSRTYDSRDEHQSTLADAGVWLQTWGWSVGLEYAPIEYLSLGAAVEHGMPVLRGGVVNVDFLHRDATELVFSLNGRY